MKIQGPSSQRLGFLEQVKKNTQKLMQKTQEHLSKTTQKLENIFAKSKDSFSSHGADNRAKHCIGSSSHLHDSHYVQQFLNIPHSDQHAQLPPINHANAQAIAPSFHSGWEQLSADQLAANLSEHSQMTWPKPPEGSVEPLGQNLQEALQNINPEEALANLTGQPHMPTPPGFHQEGTLPNMNPEEVLAGLTGEAHHPSLGELLGGPQNTNLGGMVPADATPVVEHPEPLTAEQIADLLAHAKPSHASSISPEESPTPEQIEDLLAHSEPSPFSSVRPPWDLGDGNTYR